MAILLALTSALVYGLSDFVGGVVSRRTSAWAVAVLGQSSAAVCTAVTALVVGGDPTGTDFAWALLAGVGSGAGVGYLYRGFASGRMSVVAPVSAVGAAVVPVLAGTVGGERLSLLVWLGIVAALPGIWLVSSTPGDAADDASPRVSLAEGLVDGLLAGLGFGVLFAALGQIPEGAGLLPLDPHPGHRRARHRRAGRRPARALGAPRPRRPLGAARRPPGRDGQRAFLLATQQGFLTVAGVLTSLYPASTVLLAALVLHERIHRTQGLGLALCGAAIALVAAG